MRDIRLARRQFFGGLLLSAITLVVGYFVLLPEYKLAGDLKQQTQHPDPLQLKATTQLPVIYSNNPEGWEKTVIAPFYKDSLAAKTLITDIKGDYTAATPVTGLPQAVQKVPITLTLNGSYFSIQTFVTAVSKRLSTSPIRMVELKNVDTETINPNESPILQAIIQIDLIVLNGKM